MTKPNVVFASESEIESKERVCGLKFHTNKPWILAGLERGEIQLWDYSLKILVRRFGEHRGAVRGVDVRKSSDYFVSGGDDRKLRVWEFQTPTSLFRLKGHGGMVNTVKFHHCEDWVLSGSGDNTVRIWSLLSRVCLRVLRGHTGPVSSASFHPTLRLVISASLDKSLRLWKLDGLDPRSEDSAGSAPHERRPRHRFLFGGLGCHQDDDDDDPIVSLELEGHAAGVQWASFHPTLPHLIFSADDRQIKWWEWKGNSACEIYSSELCSLDGHTFSSVVFHAKQNLVVSNDDAGGILVLGLRDIRDRAPDTVRPIPRFKISFKPASRLFLQERRFSTVAIHQEETLMAAGDDRGLMVFKLERERPAYTVCGDFLIYEKDMYLRCYEFSTKLDRPVFRVFGPGRPRTLSYCPQYRAFLTSGDADGGYYELYTPKEVNGVNQVNIEPFRGIGTGMHSSVFLSIGAFVVLQTRGNGKAEALVFDLHNSLLVRVNLPHRTHAIFSAKETECVLCIHPTGVMKTCLSTGALHGGFNLDGAKHAVWSPSMNNVAFLCKSSIYVTDYLLERKYSINVERGGHVKSAAWDEKEVLFYSTLTEIIYRCPNGHTGTTTLDNPLYITKVSAGGLIYCLDSNADIKVLHAKDDLGYDDVEPAVVVGLEHLGAGDVAGDVEEVDEEEVENNEDTVVKFAGDVEEVDVDEVENNAVADMNEELAKSLPIWDHYEDDELDGDEELAKSLPIWDHSEDDELDGDEELAKSQEEVRKRSMRKRSRIMKILLLSLLEMWKRSMWTRSRIMLLLI